MRTYTQLTQEQRYQILARMKTGENQTEIAQPLHVTNPPLAVSSPVIAPYRVFALSRPISWQCFASKIRPHIKQFNQLEPNRRTAIAK